jgi:hypothetical protein
MAERRVNAGLSASSGIFKGVSAKNAIYGAPQVICFQWV